MARRSALFAAAGLGVAALAAAIAIMPSATAGTRPAAVGGDASLDAVAPDMLAALQKDLGLNATQARTLLTKERHASRTDAAIQGVLGTRYAGAWVTGGSLTVAVTDAAAADLVRKTGAQATVVSRSAAQLDAATARLDTAGAPRGVAGWYVDVKANQLVVLVKAGGQAAAAAFAKASGLTGSAVRLEATTENPRTLIDVIGGNAYFIGSGTRCSIGFSVNGGFVTAGHCGQTGSTTSQPSGSFGGSSFPGNDYGWVRVAAGNTPRPLVNGYGAGNITVAGSSQAPVGSTVCRSGSTTGRRCGTVAAYNASVTYPQGTVTGLIRTSVCAEPGDSGGSLLWNNQAQGVTSGGSGNCTSGGTTFFQPVNEILQVFGLTLLTGGGGTTPPTTPPQTTPPGGTTWAPNTAYATGAIVTYAGQRYQCRQGHTSQVGWEPPNVLALWLPI